MSVLSELSSLRRTGGREVRQAGRRRLRRDGPIALFFLGPWFIGLFAITAGPLVSSLYLSFTDFDLLTNPQWIGIQNYVQMFADARWWKSLQVTFTYVAIAIPLQLAFALFLALVLDKGLRGLSFYRSVYYLPSLLGGSVAVAILWRQLFGRDGLINQFLAVFGIEGPGWVAHPDTALGTLIILGVWMFGSPMVIFLAGLRQIPDMYYEAGALDGAGKWRQFWSITFPLLTPIIFFNLVLQMIGAFQSFTGAFIVSNGTGGPADSTLFYTLYLYQEGFGGLRMGYASAMAWILLLIIGAFTALNFLFSKYWVHYDD
ncbi:carbohydrate ABC transporter permease [Microbacterium ulmi]|uniref:Sugar ABC transporter permease n=1 Tax=Microbacterium ulmi TaxID=179095 RepID=A0A7Y2Q2V0_9MICO|nr:sugar ABC transporter permease [Microbacterium ulmi]NII68589.1 multiple sugar transport system permease protein [Microbacterium ulmi]NNH05038.1 sugar ABC transporter permease [Microbacterium ulmi]